MKRRSIQEDTAWSAYVLACLYPKPLARFINEPNKERDHEISLYGQNSGTCLVDELFMLWQKYKQKLKFRLLCILVICALVKIMFIV